MSSIHIVLADDNQPILDLLQEVLTDEGYSVDCYRSGHEALAAIQQQSPQLVILDMQMEHKEAGLQVLRQMRVDAAAEHVPVIIYSADTLLLRSKWQEIQSYNGAVVEKPFQLDALLQQVQVLLTQN